MIKREANSPLSWVPKRRRAHFRSHFGSSSSPCWTHKLQPPKLQELERLVGQQSVDVRSVLLETSPCYGVACAAVCFRWRARQSTPRESGDDCQSRGLARGLASHGSFNVQNQASPKVLWPRGPVSPGLQPQVPYLPSGQPAEDVSCSERAGPCWGGNDCQFTMWGTT